MRNLLLAVTVILCNLSIASTSDFELANTKYQEAAYVEAIKLYQSVLDEGIISDEVFYNLANAYFKQGEIAKAILNYEKALKINPAHEDAAFNLAIANEKTIDKIESIPNLFIYRWWIDFINLFSLDSWATLAIIFLVLFVIAFSLYFFGSKVSLKKASFYSGISCLILFFFCWFAASRELKNWLKKEYAIVTTPTINVNSSPSEGSSKLFVLHEGTKVKIEDELENWYEISIPNGNSGWVTEDLISFIAIAKSNQEPS